MSGYRLSYSTAEEKDMLRFIIDNDNYHRIKGDMLYKEMHQTVTSRTWHSLKNHLKRHLIQKIHWPKYCLSQNEIAKLRIGFQSTVDKQKHASDSEDSQSESSQETRRKETTVRAKKKTTGTQLRSSPIENIPNTSNSNKPNSNNGNSNNSSPSKNSPSKSSTPQRKKSFDLANYTDSSTDDEWPRPSNEGEVKSESETEVSLGYQEDIICIDSD